MTQRDLRDSCRGHGRLVEEDASEVVAVGEDLGLERQERPARVDQVDAGQPVLGGDFLGPEVLLDREGVVRAALHGGVVGHDGALAALDRADARDHARGRRVAAVAVPGGERPELEEGGVRVEQALEPFAHG